MSKVPKISVNPAKRPRNGFDRSETHLYSQPAGMILPVYQMFMQPNDHVSIDTRSIVQAQTLKGRPFLGMKQNFAFYFVPCRLMYSYSKALFTGLKPKNTLISSLLSNNAAQTAATKPVKAPVFKPYQVFARFAGAPDESGNIPDMSTYTTNSANQGTKIFGGAVDSPSTPTGFNEDPGFFGGKNSRPNGRQSGNDDVLASAKPASGVPTGSFNDVQPEIGNSPFGKYLVQKSPFYDALGYPLLPSYVRFCDLFRYGAMPYIGESINVNEFNASMFAYEANLFYFLAYQKIYQDHFLDSNFENVNPLSYNVDDLFSTDSMQSKFDLKVDIKSLDRALDIFSPRYVKYNKDLLSNIHPSPLFIDDVSQTIKSFVGSDTVWSGNNTSIVKDSPGFVSAANLRNLFAFDKMQQISSRAPKTYKGQMLAHYGVNVADDMTESIYCGGFQKVLEVNPVIATSDGQAADSSTNFGQQGSYIDSGQSGHVNFDAKEHGVLMCVSWFSPASLYDSDGIDAFNVKFAREDYFVPEMEDLGMQPIDYSRLLPPWASLSDYRLPDMSGAVEEYYSKHQSDVKAAYDKLYRNSRLSEHGRALGNNSSKFPAEKVYGWQPRYHEYKSGADYIHGEFKTGRSMQVLTLHRPTPFNYQLGVGMIKGRDFPNKNFNGVPAGFLFVDPACTNEVVEVNYDGTEKTDPFRISTEFNVSYISDMSVSGMPKV
ncbi:major capsid protein [Segatella salivae]|nr:major capsid protein [Segatella salivae]